MWQSPYKVNTLRMNKKIRYDELCLKVKEDYKKRDQCLQFKETYLRWCEECEEINLWTYWQGRNCYSPKIMLVGQDWGSPWDKNAKSTMAQIRLANEDKPYDYLNNNPSKTDANLIQLFSEIGYIDIMHPHKDLFFTNFVLGYRNRGCSGGYRKAWAEQDMAYFGELMEILSPKVILCLGRATFEAVLKALSIRSAVRIGNYNQFITSDRNPVTISQDGSDTIHIFALAHCGALGTFNRNRSKGRLKDPLEIQRADWKRIIPYL